MNMIQIKGKRLSVEITLDELGTTLEGLMGYVAWIEAGNKNEFLESELSRCRAVIDKLDMVWCDEHEL